ncbi:MAG: DNA repair protein RecO [Endomicrobiales bacterium]|nr:DNA repair protein RecO [Endomicrobiales bacterium]
MYYNLEGLVLRSNVSSEADKLLVLYTREWGKITASVPGAKKIKAKYSAAAEPVMEAEFMVYVKASGARPKVTGARILESFPPLRSDCRRFWTAQYCAEVCEMLTPFDSPNNLKYSLLKRTWELLCGVRNPQRIATAFILRFLKLSGYGFSDYLKNSRKIVSSGHEKLIRKLSSLSGADIDENIEISRETEDAIRRHLDSYISLYLPRPLAAREFFKKMEMTKENRAAEGA